VSDSEEQKHVPVMDRGSLDRLSLEQLREEARRYHLSTSGDRRILIDTIMSYFERYAPVQDLTSNGRDTGRRCTTESHP